MDIDFRRWFDEEINQLSIETETKEELGCCGPNSQFIVVRLVYRGWTLSETYINLSARECKDGC